MNVGTLLDDVDPPDPVPGIERQAKYYAAHTERVAKAKTAYRHDNSKWQTDAKYLSRPFVAWDGEGITDPDGSHRYVMLAVKSATDSDYQANAKGLSTAQCFDMILDAGERNPGAIHVIYGGSYDFNMMLRDLPKAEVKLLVTNKFHQWQNYRLAYRQSKSFYVCKVDYDGNKIGKGVTIYDVVSFFQCAFVKACDSYLGDSFTNREMIVSNKALRSSFTDADIPDVRKYNDAELQNLLSLVRELRKRLNKVGLRPRRWDGPGAVASALLMRENVKAHMSVAPDEVARAARYAYAGGRFEVVKFGHVEGSAYEYDVNSAYPAAMTELPSLAGGSWEHIVGDPGPVPYALYHVEYCGTRADLPGAFFRRDSNGTICYPLMVTGWYWSPEVATGRKYCAEGYGNMSVKEAWVFHPATDTLPFEFVLGLYNKRRALKKAGDGAHMGIKLGINSLYGKTAQQVGWEIDTVKGLRIPPFHQLEWAGFTTSWCRAKVLEACLGNLENVIAFETDAMFTSVPLPVKVGTGLGEWEATEFSSLTYVTSGIYFGTKIDGEVVKTRGVDLGQMDRADVLARMGERLAADRTVTVSVTRFIGAKLALAQDWSKWRRWVTMTKEIHLEPTGKRIHDGRLYGSPCGHDAASLKLGESIKMGIWHHTVCPYESHKHSAEFPIEWVNPDPAMAMLTDLRESDKEYE